MNKELDDTMVMIWLVRWVEFCADVVRALDISVFNQHSLHKTTMDTLETLVKRRRGKVML